MKIIVNESRLNRIIKSYILDKFGEFYHVYDEDPTQYYNILGFFSKSENEPPTVKVATAEGKNVAAIDRILYYIIFNLFSFEDVEELNPYIQDVILDVTGIKIHDILTMR